MIKLKRILVPTDFSECSAAALRYGRALTEAFHGSLHVLHVVEEPVVPGWTAEGYIPNLPSFRESLGKHADEQLGKLLTHAERERFSAQLSKRFGNPFIEIVRYAKQNETDLIIMGTHGRGPIAHMLLGSVAEKVVRKAPCPVLTVHHPEHEFVVP